MAGRNIVLCLDGTWNGSYSIETRSDGRKIAKPTNILKLARALPSFTSNQKEQVIYYESGVGASESFSGKANWVLKTVDNILGGAFGAGFETKVQNALTFIINNYREGDQVYVFGFSRGASVARGVCKLLDWLSGDKVASGRVFKKDDAYYLPHAIRAYFDNKAAKSFEDISKKFSRFSGELKPIYISVLGVYDTVLSLGSRLKEEDNTHLLSIQAPSCVENAIHAIAIDERRKDFKPELWTKSRVNQSLKQRWFSGVHSNVGGGYPQDGLANCALDWIIAEASSSGLEFRQDYLQYFEPHPTSKLYNSRKMAFVVGDLLRLHWKRRSIIYDYPTTTIDYSVFQRMLELENYRPKELIRSLKKLDDTQIESLINDVAMQASGRRTPVTKLLDKDTFRKIVNAG